MPGVKKQYTSAVMGKIDPDKRVTFEDRKEYEPSERCHLQCTWEKRSESQGRDIHSKIDQDFYLECPVRILENKDVDGGIVNGAMGTLKGCTEHGKHPIIKLKNSKRYTLSCSSAEIFVDDYSSQQRRAIMEGSVRPKQGRHGGKVYVQVLPDPCAVTPHGLQGLTAETLIIHPNVNYAHEYTRIECYFMALSRLCSSGLDSPGKGETLRAIPRPTSHLGLQMISLSLVDYN